MILVKNDYKDIIINSFRFLVSDKRIKIHAFVIMPNHIHIVWSILSPHILSEIQRDFLKYTAQQLKFKLERENPEFLKEFLVNAKDRKYQIWERKPLSAEIETMHFLEQKINYIHMNPVREKWNLAESITDYKYSSARFYHDDTNKWEFLSHYSE